MTPAQRQHFDQELDTVIAALPTPAQSMLEATTMYVEDHPSREVMQRMGVHDPRCLCGLYSGVPLTHRHVDHSGILSEAIFLYRWGITEAARDERGRVTPEELREQIRITILHELGHHHGLDEDDLAALGY